MLALSIAALMGLCRPTVAQTIDPINRADIFAGSRCDVKVEFPAVVDAARTQRTVDGRDAKDALGATAPSPPARTARTLLR